MSKYNSLWEYVKKDRSPSLKLTFDEIENIAGVPIDHSFLKYKKELTEYGYQVGKISMKQQTVIFNKMSTREIILFIAMSLDGCIADKDGGVGWLNGQGCESETLDVYSEFAKDIDTVLMGWNTYHQITTELSPDEWIYRDFTTYVITHNETASSEQIHFTGEDPVSLLKRLKSTDGKNIWICGGANLVQQIMHSNLIDQYYISVIPTLLGSGIRLFGNMEKEIKLKLLKTQTYNGITDLVYTRR